MMWCHSSVNEGPIQRQIIREWCKMELYLQWRTNSNHVVYDPLIDAIFNDFERPGSQCQASIRH